MPTNGHSPDDGELPNLGTLIKLLKMTTSSNDNEALLAMRMANKALTKFGGDWEALLRGKVTVIGDPFDGAGEVPAPPPRRTTEPPRPPRPAPPPRPQTTWQSAPKPFSAKPATPSYSQSRRSKRQSAPSPSVDQL